MRAGLISLAAAAIIAAAIPVANTASAEEFHIHAGENGVGVRVGEDGYHHRHDRWREGRRFDRDCRTTTVKHRAPDGTVVIRKTRSCD